MLQERVFGMVKVGDEDVEAPGNSPWRVLCHPPSSDHLTTPKLQLRPYSLFSVAKTDDKPHFCFLIAVLDRH
jgi:hypothetical protein